MERLTRTQKYADLRTKISQDQETSLSTNDLDKYEDKLKRLEDFFKNNGVETKDNSFSFSFQESDENENIQEEEKELKPIDEILEPIVEKVAEAINTPFEENEIQKEESTPVYEEPAVEVQVLEPVEVTPVYEEPEEEVVINKETRSLDEILAEEVSMASSIVEVVSPTNVVIEKEEEVYEEPVIETFASEQVVETPVVEAPVEQVVETPVQEVNESVSQDTTDKIEFEEIVDDKVVETPSYVQQLFDDVKNYNKENNQKDIAEFSNDIIDELRHQDALVRNNASSFEQDGDFSNTVSLEIDKVLNEIGNENVVSVDPALVVGSIPNTEELEKTAELAFNEAEVKALNAASEEVDNKEPVIIKNLSEMQNENLLEDTIPFSMNSEPEKEELDEEEDLDIEDNTSKALNVILGILIFVLIAVLGVIVYYILYYNGILG